MPTSKLLHFALIFIACLSAAKAETKQPNILWISAEDISPAFGIYGDKYAKTPNIDRLAESSQVFTKAYATAPICAPARSCLITGVYASSMGTQHLRSDVPIPDTLKTLPELLSAGGYYTTNNSKTDYNFDPEGRWDELGNQAHWKNQAGDKPFFSVFNYGLTHEGNGNRDGFDWDELLTDRVDPDEIELPPYFPKTKVMKQLYARYYDLITVFDITVGKHLEELEEAGILDDTVVFVFSDHGFGLPRYKRWLYDTGLRVPLVVHVPERFASSFNAKPGKRNDLVSFLDFAPSVLDLANVSQPDTMKGQSIFAQNYSKPYVYGARSRADDVLNVGRAVIDERYVYIRNFTPHRPYIEPAVIFAPDSKGSFRELHRLRNVGELNPEAAAFWEPRPAEELFDLKTDPHELNNLADDPKHRATLQRLRAQMSSKIREARDVGLLHESEYMRRASQTGQTVYEYAKSEAYDLDAVLNAAETVGRPEVSEEELIELLEHSDSGVRYWGAIALQQRKSQSTTALSALQEALHDPSPAVSLAAAETLCYANHEAVALPTIAFYLQMKREPTTVLNAAMVARRIGSKAKPLLALVRSEYENYKGDVWGRYATWRYPMFIGMAFDQIRINCGEDLDLSR